MLDFVVVHVENAPSVSGMRACLALNIVKLVRIVQAQKTPKHYEKFADVFKDIGLFPGGRVLHLKPSAIPVVCPPLWDHSKDHSKWHHADLTTGQSNTSMNHTSLSDSLSGSYLHKMSFKGRWMRPSGCHIFLLFEMPPDSVAPVMWYITLTRKRALSTQWKDGYRHLVFRRGISQSVFWLSPLHVNWDKDQIQMPKSNSDHSCLCSACCSSIHLCLVYS